MQKIIVFIVSALLVFASCKKPATSCSNTVTVTGGTSNYSTCSNRITGPVTAGEKIGVSAGLYRGIGKSALIIGAVCEPFQIVIKDSVSLNGTPGSYPLQMADSNYNIYTENLNARESYKCSGGVVNLSHCDSSNISGTFTLNIFNTTKSKVISGAFNANQPDFQ